MIQHQPRQRRHHILARGFGQNVPVRLRRSDPLDGVEEIELTQHLISPPASRRMSCGHGLLSNSVLGNPWMRPNARQSTPVPPAVRAPAHRSASCAATPAPPDRRSATPTSSPGRKRRDRTSRPARPGRDRCPPGRSCRATSPRSLPCENGDFEPKPLARSALLSQVRSVASRLIARLPEYCCGAPLPSRRVPRPDRRSGNALSPRSKARGDQGHKRRERW